MTTTEIQRLINVAGSALSESTPRISEESSRLAGSSINQLLQLLWARNGFYAFESALHVYPISDEPGAVGLNQWNAGSLWRDAYGGLADDLLFFAEDVFGGQFCITDGEICRFNSETGLRERIAGSIDDWARLMLADTNVQTGWPLAHEWQQRFRPLLPGERLVPKVPFVLGGEFEVSNLHALDGVKAMRFYGNLAVQIRDAPDGTQVHWSVED